MKVLLTHPGTQYSPMLATQLAKQGILYKYATGVVFPDAPNSWWWRWLGKLGMQQVAKKRLAAGVAVGEMHWQPWPELWAMFRQRVLKHQNDPVFYQRNAWFQRQLPQGLIAESDIVIGFDTSSWILANRVKQAGKLFVLDASIAHPLAKEAVFENVVRRYPQWGQELAPKRAKNIAVELQEMERADHIVVASSFTKNSYLQHGVAAEKISVNPYGTDLSFFNSKWAGETPFSAPKKADDGLVFFFFGSITARKGFPWLCDIWEKFYAKYPNCKLVAGGYGQPPAGFLLPAGIQLIGAIHPQQRSQWFKAADVFVFPSFFEGFAQVIIEAMASGLPVITTTHTAAPDMMTSGKEGFVIAPGSDTDLVQALSFFAENPQQIEPMGRQARQLVEGYTWEAYGSRWKTILETMHVSFQR